MKQLAYLIMALPLTALAGTEIPDSIKQLDEITVVASMQNTDATKTVYMPDPRQRRDASDGITLLSRMNIPQLDVNPLNRAVKTAAGEGVSVFINSSPATPEDVAGLNPADVRRVEYMDYPADPRYMRAPHVVNFVVRGYIYGGYTKLDVNERFFVNSVDGQIYSKFAYRQMEYDLMVTGGFAGNSHNGSDSRETFRFPQRTIDRDATVTAGKQRSSDLFGGFRSSWRKQNLSWRNLVTVSLSRQPVNRTSGQVAFSEYIPDSEYELSAPSRLISLGWGSEFYSSFAHGWSLNGEFQLTCDNNRVDNTYESASAGILTRARERGWFMRGSVQADKSLSERISLFCNLLIGGGGTDTRYSGSEEASNRFGQFFSGVTAGVSMKLGKIAGSVDAGYAFESNKINATDIDDGYPFTHVSLQYAPDRKNSLNLFFQYVTFSPDAAMKSPNMIRQNELLYVAGNPRLDYSRHIGSNVSYTYLPSNRWQATAYVSFFRIADRQAPVYAPDGPDGAMLKRYYNDGDYNHGQIGASLTGKFLGGALAVTLSPRMLFYRITGSNSITHNPFMVSAQANYSVGHLFFSAYWGSRWSYVDGETCYMSRVPSDYSVSAGWTSGRWNIQLQAANVFRSSWILSRDTLHSRYYDGDITRYGAEHHRRVKLSVTYTINYGKRVDRSSEIRSQDAASSTILR